MDNKQLRELAALDLSTYPYEKVKALLASLMQIGIIEYTLHQGKTITRGRTNGKGSFSEVGELSYKPQQYNSTYQRASTPQRTMFYGSVLPANLSPEDVQQERAIAVSEASGLLRNAYKDQVSSLQKEVVTFGSWEVIEDVPLLAICYHKTLSQNNSLGKELYEAFKDGIDTSPLTPTLKKQSYQVNEFLAEEYAKPSHEFGGDYDYLISAVFAELAVDNGYAGVYFPSVKAQGKGFNVAISPAYCERCLQLRKVLECTIYKRGKQVYLDNEAFCVVAPGSQRFQVAALTDPALRLGEEAVVKHFDEQEASNGK